MVPAASKSFSDHIHARTRHWPSPGWGAGCHFAQERQLRIPLPRVFGGSCWGDGTRGASAFVNRDPRNCENLYLRSECFAKPRARRTACAAQPSGHASARRSVRHLLWPSRDGRSGDRCRPDACALRPSAGNRAQTDARPHPMCRARALPDRGTPSADCSDGTPVHPASRDCVTCPLPRAVEQAG